MKLVNLILLFLLCMFVFMKCSSLLYPRNIEKDVIPAMNTANLCKQEKYKFYNHQEGFCYVMNICVRRSIFPNSTLLINQFYTDTSSEIIDKKMPANIIKSIFIAFHQNRIYYYSDFNRYSNFNYKEIKDYSATFEDVYDYNELISENNLSRGVRKMMGNYKFMCNNIDFNTVATKKELLKDIEKRYKFVDNSLDSLVFCEMIAPIKEGKKDKIIEPINLFIRVLEVDKNDGIELFEIVELDGKLNPKQEFSDKKYVLNSILDSNIRFIFRKYDYRIESAK
ncbi:MAG: hypothetical protein V9E90_16985 [Saprospiraceae bacterium]